MCEPYIHILSHTSKLYEGFTRSDPDWVEEAWL